MSKTALDSIGSNLNSQIGAAASSFDSFLKEYPSTSIASLMDKTTFDSVRNTLSHFETAMSGRIADSILKDFSSSNAASLLSQATALNSIGSNLDSQIGAAASSFDSFLKNHPSANIASLMDKAALDNVRNTISHFETAMSNRVVDSILKDFSSPDYEQDSEKIDAIILQQQLNNLSKAKDRASFANLFAKLPPWLQNTILALVILNTFLGDIRSAIIDSYVKQFIVCQLFLISCTTDETDLSNQPIQERIKSLRDLPIEWVNGNYFRFVKIEYLNVYSKPNQKSHILDELILGQTVVILKKERNWVEIAFRNENGEIHYGWVFNRYLKKFQ